MLILFDIDGTLLTSRRAGVGAFLAACGELFRREVVAEGRRFSGGLDPLIFRSLCEMHEFDATDDHHDRFRRRYAELLGERLAEQGVARALPGVAGLLLRLAAVEELTLGLLTGNYPETGRMKITAAGLDPGVFRLGAFGIDGDSRRALPAVAMERYARLHGRAAEPERVLIIGDTPNDVDCARHAGCLSLAVATGLWSVEELLDCGPDHAVESLADTEGVARWITAGLGLASRAVADPAAGDGDGTPAPPPAGRTDRRR